MGGVGEGVYKYCSAVNCGHVGKGLREVGEVIRGRKGEGGGDVGVVPGTICGEEE